MKVPQLSYLGSKSIGGMPGGKIDFILLSFKVIGFRFGAFMGRISL
jgi:hypothetical protein